MYTVFTYLNFIIKMHTYLEYAIFYYEVCSVHWWFNLLIRLKIKNFNMLIFNIYITYFLIADIY